MSMGINMLRPVILAVNNDGVAGRCDNLFLNKLSRGVQRGAFPPLAYETLKKLLVCKELEKFLCIFVVNNLFIIKKLVLLYTGNNNSLEIYTVYTRYIIYILMIKGNKKMIKNSVKELNLYKMQNIYKNWVTDYTKISPRSVEKGSLTHLFLILIKDCLLNKNNVIQGVYKRKYLSKFNMEFIHSIHHIHNIHFKEENYGN